MDNLIYDLQQHHINNKNNKLLRSKKSKPERYSNKKLSNAILLAKRKKLMKVLIATAAAVSESSNRSTNLVFKDLVRIKRFNKINLKKQHKLLNKKKKSSFRIQKTYRFRNYRLRCIRLRQSQLKERRRQLKTKPSSRVKRFTATATTSNRMSSSCAETSDSNLTTNSSKNNVSSSSEETLSLVECFKHTKFLNSSDTREEDVDDLKLKSNKLQNYKISHNKKHRIHCFKQTKSSFKKKLTRLGNKSLMIKENRYLNLKQSQLICDCHYCNYKLTNNTAQHQQHHINNQLNLNKLYLKRKRFTNREETIDENKKIKYQCGSPEYSLSSVQSSGEDNMMKDDFLADSSIKSDDTDESNRSPKKSNATKTNSLKIKKENNVSSNDEEEEEDDLDDTGADDEQSDWPANENTCNPISDHKLHIKTLCKSANQLNNSTNSSSSQIVDFNEKNSFKIIPWWNQNDSNDDSLLVNKYKSNQSNYEKMNENLESDNSEFDQLFNGAFNLISSSSKRNFHDKMVIYFK